LPTKSTIFGQGKIFGQILFALQTVFIS